MANEANTERSILIIGNYPPPFGESRVYWSIWSPA